MKHTPERCPRGLSRRTFVAGGMGLFLLPRSPLAEFEIDPGLRRYSGIVVDVLAKKVLYQTAARELRYPASLTKIMTLYILFEEMAARRLSLSSRVTISEYAEGIVPVKLGLRAGETVSIEDLMLSMVTLSANDSARAIAEHISTSEASFVERMNETAQRLGMSSTRYKYATGMHHRDQVTTAHDQAILAAAISTDFPRQYRAFKTTSFRFRDRTYGNHNRFIGYMEVVDGIKTGYSNASGYSIVLSARGEVRHLVVVLMGMETGARRDQKARLLLRAFWKQASFG